jgi:kynureninase
MGRRDAFTMGPGYAPADGVRAVLSGTPPILAMVPLQAMLDLLDEVGMPAVQAKSRALTAYALDLVDEWLVPQGAVVTSPRDPERRGGHVTVRRPYRTIASRTPCGSGRHRCRPRSPRCTTGCGC